ncbi:hypothetical protein CTAYLR_008333 [Chrysophaeum taylorii]|uniref:RNA-polymerase II-associated protein 3-like C-terminal domain-containing protein n=1 Tax=Chrysophaeum taylorii TaxID=2483200 RepID=A0AAD7UET6_9STRA|nr:hypothetical protein CTAYLR_008333 [Chrysophaeum taylorii]
MAELGSLGGTVAGGRDIKVTAAMMDYEYAKKCRSVPELRAILARLESGKEGKYEDLEKYVQSRILLLAPKTRVLGTKPTASDKAAAERDLDLWLEGTKAPSRLDDARPPSAPVRGRAEAKFRSSSEEAHPPKKKGEERISGYDWDAWEKFKVDDDTDEEDSDEETSLAEKRAESRKARMTRLREDLETSELPGDQREFLAERERRKGNEAYRAKEFDDAKYFYSRSLAYADDARVYANRALVALSLGNLEDSEADCDAALRLEPAYDKARARRAVTRYKRGRFQEALDDFALVKNSDSKIEKLKEIARTKLAEERAQKAAASTFVRVAIRDEDDEDQETSRIPISTEEDEDEDEDEEEPPPLTSSNPVAASKAEEEVGTRIAVALEEEEEDETRIEEEEPTVVDEQSEETRKAAAEAAKARGTEAMKRGDLVEAAKLYSESLDIFETVAARNNRCLALLKLEKWTDAIGDATTVLSVEPKNPKALFRRGLAHRGRGDLDAALADLADLVSLEPANKLAKQELEKTKACAPPRDNDRPPPPPTKVVSPPTDAPPPPPKKITPAEERAARANAIAAANHNPGALPPPAKTPYELERVWCNLRNRPDRQIAYISQFKAAQFKKLVAPTLDVFGDILLVVAALEDKRKASELLIAATQARSFDMILALLKTEHALAIRNLIATLDDDAEAANRLFLTYDKLLRSTPAVLYS